MAQNDLLKNQRIIYLTAGYIKGELVFDEQEELTTWKSENLANRLLFDELVNDDSRAAALKRIQQFNTEESLLRMKLQMQQIKSKKGLHKKYYGYAAAIILIIGLSVLFIQYQKRPPQLLTVSVPYGKKIQLTLPDSSKIWLNAGTTIQYPEHFNGRTRSIILKDGQAYFEIVHDANKPFIVDAGNINVSVLGTSFEVSTFIKENAAIVTVKTGKVGVVELSTRKAATFLLPGDRAIISKSNHSISKTKVALTDIAAWRDQRLIFEEQPLGEVMASLEREYNVHIQIENKNLLTEKVTMRLNHQPLNDVLAAISFSNHLNYQIVNEQLIIVK